MTNGNTIDADETQVRQAERIAAPEKLMVQLSLDKLMLESTITVLVHRREPKNSFFLYKHFSGLDTHLAAGAAVVQHYYNRKIVTLIMMVCVRRY